MAFDPFSRPLDRLILTLRREFGSDAVHGVFPDDPDEIRADYWRSVCPLHPSYPRTLTIRERRGPGSSLWLSCASECLPSLIAEELRRLEAWHVLQRQEAA